MSKTKHSIRITSPNVTTKGHFLNALQEMEILYKNLNESDNKDLSNLDFIAESIVERLEKGAKILFTGIGKNFYSCTKLAATFQSLNIPALAFDATHALHGDLGLIKPNDIIIGFSKSGSTLELTQTMKYISDNEKKFGYPYLIGVRFGQSGDTDSPMHPVNLIYDNMIAIPEVEELDNWNRVPTVSAVLLQLIGDALAIRIAGLYHKDFTLEDFQFTHPGGSIGGKN